MTFETTFFGETTFETTFFGETTLVALGSNNVVSPKNVASNDFCRNIPGSENGNLSSITKEE